MRYIKIYMVLTKRMQELLLNVDGKKGATKVLAKGYVDRGYGYFLLNTLVKLGLLSFKRVRQSKIYSLTPIGKQLKEILSNLPEVNHEWKWNSETQHNKTLEKKNAKFLVC